MSTRQTNGTRHSSQFKFQVAVGALKGEGKGLRRRWLVPTRRVLSPWSSGRRASKREKPWSQ